MGCRKSEGAAPPDSGPFAAVAPRNIPRPSAPLNVQPNLLTNGTFEPGGAPSAFAGWESDLSDAAVAKTRDGALSAEEQSRAHLELSQAGTAGWSQRVDGIDPAIRYRLRALVRASNVAPGAHALELQWLDASGVVLSRVSAEAGAAGKWDEVVVNDLTPPTGAVSARVQLRAYAAGSYAFDDVFFTRQDESVHAVGGALPLSVYDLTSINLISNGDMEQRRYTASSEGSAGAVVVCSAPDACELPAFWNTWVEQGTATQRWEALGPGAHALVTEVLAGSQADWRQRVPDIDPAVPYRLRASVLASNVEAGSHSVEVHWLDASGELLAAQGLVATNAGVWQQLSASGLRPPAGTHAAELVLRGALPGTYHFDDVALELDVSQVERLRELVAAGFTLASAYGTTPVPERPSLDEIALAGLKAVYRGLVPYVGSESDAQRLTAGTQLVASHPALALWYGMDEPAWFPEYCPPATELTSGCPQVYAEGYRRVRLADTRWDSAPHRVWLNHAPRGTPTSPLDFDRLREFNAGADILSMDIFPIPAGTEHANLGWEAPSSVGAYTDILYARVALEHGRQAKPIWMVPQAFAWSDLPGKVPYDGGDTRFTHANAALEVHWLDEEGRPVMRVGEDGVMRKVVDLLQSDRPNTWREVYERGLVPPPEARTAVVMLRTYGPGTYWFDDLELSPEGGANLLNNGSFEDGDGAVPAGWTLHVDGGDATSTWDDGFARSGHRSLKVQMLAGGQRDWRQEVPVRPGQRYWLRGALYARLRPTWEETRFMAYNALIHGARGLHWYGNHFIPHNSALWRDLKRVASELRVLSPALVAPASFRTVQPISSDRAPFVEAAVFQAGPDLLLLAANPHAEPTSADLVIDGLPLTYAERLFEPGPVSFDAHRVSDDFAPYQVRVYRLR